ncbi:MAG: hypothetical protein COT06_06995, partial [Syntrophobacteraceae bacterium CG07_land_8_20_14_0_80_61_8]
IWVNGRAYCSYCGGGYSGTQTLDSWINPPFYDQCWHVIQLKALIGGGFYESAPIIIKDRTYFGSYPCPEPSECDISKTGHPVDVASGKMWADQEDLRIDGPVPLVFTRRYNQRLKAVNGPFGYGWTHGYNMTVWTSAGAAHFRDGGGHEVIFAQDLAGGYAGNRRDHLSFAAITGGYRVTTADQTKYNFNTSGKLTSIVDRDGNAATLAYDGSSRLSTITDPFGRAFTLGYNASNKI